MNNIIVMKKQQYINLYEFRQDPGYIRVYKKIINIDKEYKMNHMNKDIKEKGEPSHLISGSYDNGLNIFCIMNYVNMYNYIQWRKPSGNLGLPSIEEMYEYISGSEEGQKWAILNKGIKLSEEIINNYDYGYRVETFFKYVIKGILNGSNILYKIVE
jgi:hypothetical protein